MSAAPSDPSRNGALASGASVAPPGAVQELGRSQWVVLAAAFLGWMFDGVEIGLFPLVARPALQELLRDMGDAEVGWWNGIIVACFLLGAAMGGLVFGWLGDRIGRVRGMVLAILTYSLFTGAGFWATQAWHLALFRFIASLGMGGEWAVAVALVVECWPERHRPKLAGAIGSAANFGFLFIGIVAYLFPVRADSWRWLMLVGASPAVLALLVTLFVPESERWKAARQRASTLAETPAAASFAHSALVLLGLVLVGAVFYAGQRLAGPGFFATWMRQLTNWNLSSLAWLQHAMALATCLALLGAGVLGNLAARQPLAGGLLPGLLLLAAGAVLLDNPAMWIAAGVMFVIGSTTGTRSVREIFSPELRIRTILAIVFSAIPLIGTWAAVSGWIPLWVEQMRQAQLVEQHLPGMDLTHVPKHELGPRLKEAQDKLAPAVWSEIGKQAARAKAGVQVILAVGAIIGCYVAAIASGVWGRRPVYFLLCLLSLLSCAYLFRYLTLADKQFYAVCGVVCAVTAAFYGWLPLYLPELFPTRVRATGQGLSFNFGRILAAVGSLQMGQLVQMLGGNYADAGAMITLIYVVGMVLIWFTPETKGKPLPD